MRIRSRAEDLRQIFDRDLTVEHIQENLKACDISDDMSKALSLMQAMDFDVLGIVENGNMHGYVRQDELRSGTCGDHRRTFHPSELVADSTPLIRVLSILSHQPRVFVLEGNQVKGTLLGLTFRKRLFACSSFH